MFRFQSPGARARGYSQQCERHPLCIRGFRHGGRGGHCSLRVAGAAEGEADEEEGGGEKEEEGGGEKEEEEEEGGEDEEEEEAEEEEQAATPREYPPGSRVRLLRGDYRGQCGEVSSADLPRAPTSSHELA